MPSQERGKEQVLARLERLRDAGLLDASVLEREQAWLLDEQGGEPKESALGADHFLTGASLPPTAPVAMQEQPWATQGRLAAGDCLLERYEILALLGVGGMGQVYLVYDQRRDREIAIKVLYSFGTAADAADATWPPAHWVTQLRRELSINERLTHPHILRTYDLEASSSRRLLFFTMEYIAGESLEGLLRRHGATGPLPLATSIPLLQQLAAAIDYAHGQGVIHRDVKPSNILVTTTASIKLLDFGIALVGEQSHGPAAGTAYYMAPEQLRGEPLTAAVDIYAMGVLAFQLLTGHLPQPGMPGPSALVSALPARVDQVVLQAMHWLPQQRYSSATAFAQALLQALRPLLDGAGKEEGSNDLGHLAVSDHTQANPQRTRPDGAIVSGDAVVSEQADDAHLSASAKTASVAPAVIDLAQERDAASRSTPLAIQRLHQRIQRKRPSWLEGGLQAPRSIEATDVPIHQWAYPQLPELPKGQQERLLISQRGIPLAAFVYIPPGVSGFGLDASMPEAMPAESPHCKLALDGYWIARTPITNAAWAIFLQESGYEPPAEARRSYYLRHWPGGECPISMQMQPVVWISYPVAWAFCDFYGLSLPSEAQWEKAIRGSDQRLYPWGTQPPTAELCNIDNKRGGISEVNGFPMGASPYGLLDGIGNVLEWCADRWSPRLWESCTGESDPVVPPDNAAARVAVRGGHYYAEISRLRATYRQGTPLVQSTAHTGFRPTLDWRK